ncbi:hypothetical protein SS05631_c16440 [Sinorhizobium sp. CCBAU 05631]|nr:hypothetical protein SS05631_c16440 [Sinorhizobium sp. CCBAU 05631]AWM25058.1 hypothetical protein AOX55_00001804 [Sinorhizobium fredii CCBAU 25509]
MFSAGSGVGYSKTFVAEDHALGRPGDCVELSLSSKRG